MGTVKKKAVKTVSNGRKANGQFGAGNKFGNGPGTKEDRAWRAEVIAVFRKVVPHERLEKQLERLAAKADAGNIDALRFEMEYLYGKPAQQVNLGTENGDAVKLVVHLAKD